MFGDDLLPINGGHFFQRRSRVGSPPAGRVGSGRVRSGRVGSGQVGSGRVGSPPAGGVGSRRVGSGQGDANRPVRFENLPARPVLTREESKPSADPIRCHPRDFGNLLTPRVMTRDKP